MRSHRREDPLSFSSEPAKARSRPVALALHRCPAMLSLPSAVVAIAVTAGALLVLPAGATPQLAPHVPRTSSGTVVVPVRPSVVFDALADPPSWPALLSDVTRVERDKNDARSFRVLSKLIGHSHVVELTVKRDALVHFHVSDPGPGGALDVDITLEPISGAQATRISYTMRTVLPLGMSALVDDDLVRRVREQKIVRDLSDIERHFSKLGHHSARDTGSAMGLR